MTIPSSNSGKLHRKNPECSKQLPVTMPREEPARLCGCIYPKLGKIGLKIESAYVAFPQVLKYCMCKTVCAILYVQYCMCNAVCAILYVEYCMCNAPYLYLSYRKQQEFYGVFGWFIWSRCPSGGKSWRSLQGDVWRRHLAELMIVQVCEWQEVLWVLSLAHSVHCLQNARHGHCWSWPNSRDKAEGDVTDQTRRTDRLYDWPLRLN